MALTFKKQKFQHLFGLFCDLTLADSGRQFVSRFFVLYRTCTVENRNVTTVYLRDPVFEHVSCHRTLQLQLQYTD